MKVFKTTYAGIFLASMILAACSNYVQDPKDANPPTLEIGIPVDQNTLEISKKEWGLRQDYVRLKGKPDTIVNTNFRQYEFYVSAQDKGGLTNVSIEVCPKDALVSGSLKDLNVTLDPSKTGSYIRSGKLRVLKLNEKVSITATATGTGKNGLQKHTTSMYIYANPGLRVNSGGIKHPDLCQSTNSNSKKEVEISLNRFNSTTFNQTYCGCVYQTGTNTSVCKPFQVGNQSINCNNTNTLSLPANTQAKWVENKSSLNIGVFAPNGKYLFIPSKQRVNYYGPIYGTWYSNFTQTVGAPGVNLLIGY